MATAPPGKPLPFHMPRFSIVLPALRPELAESALHHIFNASRGIDFEVVVVSSFAVQGTRIRHVRETERRGCNAAWSLGYRHAEGDILVCMVDDHLPRPGWLDDVDALIADREARHFPFSAGIPRPDSPWFGTAYGHYYPYFPVMSRRSVEAVGGWLNSDYKAHFGDSDLALRVWKAGGRCELLPGPGMTTNTAEDPATASPYKTSTRDADLTTLIARHHDTFGALFTREYREICLDYHLSELADGSFCKAVPYRLCGGRLWDWRSAS